MIFIFLPFLPCDLSRLTLSTVVACFQEPLLLPYLHSPPPLSVDPGSSYSFIHVSPSSFFVLMQPVCRSLYSRRPISFPWGCCLLVQNPQPQHLAYIPSQPSISHIFMHFYHSLTTETLSKEDYHPPATTLI